MSKSEKDFTANMPHASSHEFTTGHLSVSETDLLESTETSPEFCPAGWDQRIEDYFRSRMIFGEEEDCLLEHLFSCKYCAEHVSFLEEMYESLGKFDYLRLINKQ
jgi:hypothetical protein